MNCTRTLPEHFVSEGVQVKEIDLGQPCLTCDNCFEGYVSHHEWRKECSVCKCSRDNHEIIVEHGAKARLGRLTRSDGYEIEPRSLGYSFVPPGLVTARQVDSFYSHLSPIDVPRLGTRGETARTQRLVKQLPRQDLCLTACKYVDSQNQDSYKDFINARNEIALDVGVARMSPQNVNCFHCNKNIAANQACVMAPRMGNHQWHPECFRCTSCSDLLVDLAYCVQDDKIYCERHYAELLKPRCAACDEVSARSSSPKRRYCRLLL